MSYENNLSLIKRALMGGQDYLGNFHYSIFNYSHLHSLLGVVGFKKIRGWDPKNCEHHDFNDWASKTIEGREKQYEVSLNLEAIK
jgi:hypothetical protein